MAKNKKKIVNNLPERESIATGTKAEKEHAEAVRLFNLANVQAKANFTPRIRTI
jgi:hypothetical protein